MLGTCPRTMRFVQIAGDAAECPLSLLAILAATESHKRSDAVGKPFELNAASTKGGENAHWNSRTSYSYPRVYPEKIET